MARRSVVWPALSFAAAATLVASAVGAQVLAHGALASRDVRVERRPDGAVVLVGAGPAATELLPAGASAPSGATVQRHELADGAAALVVRVEGESPAGALIVASRAGAPAVLFAGALAPRGDVGERRTPEILVRDFTGDGVPEVVLAERQENVRLCGVAQPVVVSARVVDPASLRLQPVALNPLRADLYSALPAGRAVNATGVTAASAAPVGRVTFAARVSAGLVGDPPAVLVDRVPATAWSARERDVATGAVTLAGVPAERVVLTAPPAPAALPRTFTLLFEPDAQRLDVTIPDGLVVPPGGRVAVPIVPARTMRCVSLVVTGASPRGTPGVAEIAIESRLDAGGGVADLVRALGGAQGDEAALLLGGVGAPGIEAVAAALPTLERAAAVRAVRLLAASRTTRGAAALVDALGRPEIAADARAALQRLGATALEPLAAVVALDARAADLVASLGAPLADRLRAIAPVLNAEAPVWRRARRAVFVVVQQAAREGALPAWLAQAPAELRPRVRALAVAAEAATDDAQRALVAAAARSITATEFRERYLLLAPLAGDAEGRAAVSAVAQRDPDADLRAEAVRALARTGAARAVLLPALEDAVPRVRAAAARGLAGAAEARAALGARLAHDHWPSVRAEAATALAGDVANGPALLAALDDDSVVVARAVMTALARTPGASFGTRLMTFAEDPRRNPDLRRDALEAIATRCERGLGERLERLASSQIDPALPPPEQAVGHAALAALAHVDPARARTLLGRMEANEFAVAAVQRASRNACPAR